MLCYRCGSHVQDGAEKCWNCGTILSASTRRGTSTSELRAKQRTGSRVFGVVFKIGDLIANRYRVKDIVGSGGAGVVYRAHDQEIDVDVAVKVINAKLVQTSDEQRLFSRQTKISRKLSHQNVVRIYDEGRDEKRPYFTMQFLEGLSLRKIIDLRKEKKQTFALMEIEPIFNQLCQALDYAHKTTFHGNLKPDNVIVLPDLLKITDFALLRGLPRKPFLAIQKSRGSNFRYLAPEVRLEVPDLTKAVDLYCLGVVLCEMLTGFVFDDAKPEQLSASTGVEASLLTIIKRAVARAPKDRYGQAGELYEDLRQLLAKGGMKITRVPAPSADPGPDGELPTQRLDIAKHGERPVSPPQSFVVPDLVEIAVAPEEMPAAEAQPQLDLPAEKPVLTEPPREPSETFALIDDDMIESMTPSAASLQASAHHAQLHLHEEPKKNGVPTNGAVAAASHHEEEEVQQDDELFDAPPEVYSGEHMSFSRRPEPEDDTQLHEEEEPTEAALLEEISNSAIELIADPRATNVVDVENKGGKLSKAEIRPHPTVQPHPLPDSALPGPAFAQVAVVNPVLNVEAPVAPQIVVRGAPDQQNGDRVGPTIPISRQPTLHVERKKAKERPMTRPRMMAMQPSAQPMVSTIPSAAAHAFVEPMQMRPQTMPHLSAASLSPQLMPPSNNRVVYFTVVVAFLAVIVAMGILVKVMSDSANQQIQAMQSEVAELRKVALNADRAEKVALAQAETAAKEVEDASKQEEAARIAVAEAKRKKAEAEAQAKKAADEADRSEREAKAEADATRREEAKKKAELARAESEARKKAVEVEAKKERDEQARAEREKKRKEAQEQAKVDAEKRAETEREAKKRAEEKAERLKADREAAAAEKQADNAEKAEKKQKADEEKAKVAEEDRRKKEEEDRRKREEEEKKLAAIAPVEDASCPKGMVLVKAGAFMLGAPRNDPERNFGDANYESVEVGAYCIDYYEYPNGRGRAPTTRVSHKTAVDRCKKRGKRLCSEEEWEKACKGPSGSRYPYGNAWNPTSCNTEDDEGNDREVTKSGTFRSCRSGYNVFDLSGNVAEWVSTQAGGRAIVKGGSSDRPGYDGRCAARKKEKPGATEELLGFRCCTEPAK